MTSDYRKSQNIAKSVLCCIQIRGVFKKFCNSIWCTNDSSKIIMLLFNI